jgi:hypothetical protein
VSKQKNSQLPNDDNNQRWVSVKSGRKKSHKSRIDTRKTYILSVSAGLDYMRLREILHDWREIRTNQLNTESHIDMIYVDGIYIDKRLYNVQCTLKNLLDNRKEIITDKSNLFFNMQETFPEIASKHLSFTQNLTDVKSLEMNDVMIIKPVGRGAFSGRDITIVTNNNGLDNAKALCSKYPKAIAVKYVRDPLLFDGRKFHIRSYMLITIQPFQVLLFDQSKILTAKDKYVDANYNNKGIHDTHISSTPRNLYFPEDLNIPKEKMKSVQTQMNTIVEHLGKLMFGQVYPYPESKHAFEVFGLDFLITQSFNVILMEVNDRVGMGSIGNIDEKYSKFSHDYFNWVYENAIKHIFPSPLI